MIGALGLVIAARLEPLAEPGGSCISGAVHDLIGSKLDLAYELMGTRSLKNIAEPVTIYAVRTEPEFERSGPADAMESPAEPEPEFYRWMGAAAALAILAVVSFAAWHYAGG